MLYTYTARFNGREILKSFKFLVELNKALSESRTRTKGSQLSLVIRSWSREQVAACSSQSQVLQFAAARPASSSSVQLLYCTGSFTILVVASCDL